MNRHSDIELGYYGLPRETLPKHSVATMPNHLIKRNHPTRSEQPKTVVGGSHSKHQSRHESRNPGKQPENRVESKNPGKQPETRPKTTIKDKPKPPTKEKGKQHHKTTKSVRFNLTQTESYQADSREYFPTTRLHRKRESLYTYNYDRPKLASHAYNRADLHSIVPPKPRRIKETDTTIAASQARARAQDLRNEVLTGKMSTEDLRGGDWPHGDGYERELAKMEQYSRGAGGSSGSRARGMPIYYADAHPTLRTSRGDRSRFFGLGWLRG